MKTKDIKADGATVYAYAKNYDWNSRLTPRTARPVVVKATGQRRKTYTGYYGSGTMADGVEIQFVEEDGSHGAVLVVRPEEIRELWETYKPVADEEAKNRREAIKERQDAQRKTAARLDAIYARLPKNAYRPLWAKGLGIHNDRSMTRKGEMSRHELADLLEVAYSAGWEKGYDARAEEDD